MYRRFYLHVPVIDFQHIEYQYTVSRPLFFLALLSLVINLQSQKLHTSALVFIVRLISQKIIGVFKSWNNSSSSQNSKKSMKYREISAVKKPRELAKTIKIL